MPVETPHLLLIPCEPSHLLALLESAEAFEARTGRHVADGLRDFYASEDVSPTWIDHLRSSTKADPWTLGFEIAHRADDRVIGACGFKGPPDTDGVIEIAYGIVPDYQGRGHATEAATALITFARADERVNRIRAHTLPAPNASTRVLTKCGFDFVAEVVDPEDGLVWRWERPAHER